MEPVQFEGLIAIIMSLAIPIFAIVFGTWSNVEKKKNEKEIRRLIIENHVDNDQAKLLITESETKNNPYKSLRWACVLCGLGLGALLNFILQLPVNGNQGVYFWILLAFGCGVGLLFSFLIELNLSKKKPLEDVKDLS